MGQNLESSASTGYKKWILFIGASVSCFLMGYAIQGDGGQKYLLAAGGFLFVISAFLGWSGGASKQADMLNTEHLKKEHEQQVLKDHLHKSNSIVHVFSDVSKLWDSNIEVSRKTTEDSIRSLSEKFSQIYSSIDAVVVRKQHNEQGLDANQQMFHAVDKSEEKLSELNNIFGVMQSGRRQLVDMVKGLAAHMEALSGMAAEVSSIAAQTNLLALNAAIEAARAGESGRGFAVVADAVRTLSTRSSDTGKKMSESVDVINSSIKELVHLSDSSIDSDNKLIEDSGQTVKDILLNLKTSSQGLVASTEQIKEQGVYVQREISDVIVALQFQDRVSQILTHVRENMNSLMCKADAYLSDPDSESALALDHWLKDMEARYATQEQRSIHSGHKPLADNNQDITFF